MQIQTTVHESVSDSLSKAVAAGRIGPAQAGPYFRLLIACLASQSHCSADATQGPHAHRERALGGDMHVETCEMDANIAKESRNFNFLANFPFFHANYQSRRPQGYGL